jgi:D-alanine-D-alanine ligase
MMHRDEMKHKKIGVLLGGRSSEREISLRSGDAVLQALLRKGYDAVAIDPIDRLVEKLEREKIEAVFIVLHGKWGEDGTVQGLLEMMGIPYTGSGVAGSSSAMDKATMKMILRGAGLPTPDYVAIRQGDRVDFPFPYVAKPANEGSTIGISIVRDEKDKKSAIDTAFRYDKKVILERFVKGSEITVAVVNGIPLPIVEVRPSKGFYDFEAKYTKGMTQYIVPAPLAKNVETTASDLALKAFRTFDLSGCTRIDMIIDGKTPMIIDINTSPGMTETSLVPKAWACLGRVFDDLIEEILWGASLKI